MAIYGGYTDDGFSRELVFYDFLDNRWKRPIAIYDKASDLPTSRQGASLLYASDRLWLFFGFSSGNFYDDIFSFELATQTWKNVTEAL